MHFAGQGVRWKRSRSTSLSVLLTGRFHRRELLGTSPYRQAEVKNRTVPQLAGDAKPAAVGFDNRFTDGQTHAGSVDLHALVSSAVELFENKRLLKIVDAGTAIGNAESECLVLI